MYNERSVICASADILGPWRCDGLLFEAVSVKCKRVDVIAATRHELSNLRSCRVSSDP